MTSAQPPSPVQKLAAIDEMERELHELQHAQRRGARRRSQLLARVEALVTCDETRTLPPDDHSAALAVVHARTKACTQQAVLTSLKLELAQLWRTLVLPWVEDTVNAFEESIQHRLCDLCTRLDRCARRLKPHRAQYRWRTATAAATLTASHAPATATHRPLAISWYVSTLGGQPEAHDGPTRMLTDAERLTPVEVRREMLAHLDDARCAAEPGAPRDEVLQTPRSLAHLLRVWHSVLPTAACVTTQHREGGEEVTPLTALARAWVSTLTSEGADSANNCVRHDASAAAATTATCEGGEAQAIQAQAADPAALTVLRTLCAPHMVESTLPTAALAASTQSSPDSAAWTALLTTCCTWWLSLAHMASTANEVKAPPPPLAAVHHNVLALLLACERTPAPVEEAAAALPEALTGLRCTLDALRAPCQLDGDELDAYPMCSALVGAAVHTRRTRGDESVLRERLAEAREWEAHHRRFCQQSEARWQEAKASAAQLVHALQVSSDTSVSTALVPAGGDAQPCEDAALVCPLRLLMDH